jgi:hypothetical protein
LHLPSTIVNCAWSATNLLSHARFRRALWNPAVVQHCKLQGYLRRNEQTAFGQAHHFSRIKGYENFARQVPLADYSALEDGIERIRNGEANVLTVDPVTHLVPTSGTTTARKLIPFTAALQREFNAAIGPWIAGLVFQDPRLLGGPAYWSVTPVLNGNPDKNGIEQEPGPRPVPIGFDSDTAYLGGARAKLIETAMAVPSDVQRAGTVEAFRYLTLLSLLRCRDLRLISVWHPTFLTLLLDALPGHWESLLNDIARGECSWPGISLSHNVRRRLSKPLPGRAAELRASNLREAATLWPRLRLVSCWADGAAQFAAAELGRRLPKVVVQPKGLIATEAFVSFPFRGRCPLAVTSHFFEFIDDSGAVHLADSLIQGEEYELVVTTAGGLWRYRVGDRVRVNGYLGRTPSLGFVGRIGTLSDRFGEKLAEPFVAGVLREIFEKDTPSFALLAPDVDETGCRYTLYLQGKANPRSATLLDQALCRNPHYAYCRQLGQLMPARVFQVRGGAYESFVRRAAGRGARIGDIKPAVLSQETGWSNCFAGAYLPEPTLRAQEVSSAERFRTKRER